MTQFFPQQIVPDHIGLSYDTDYFISFTWNDAGGTHYGSAVVRSPRLSNASNISRTTSELARAFGVINPVILFFRRLDDA